MATVADFRNWVEVSVEGAPRALVNEAILRAVDQFFRYTGLWSVEHAGIQLVNNTAAYNLTAPTGATLIRVEAARYQTQPLAPSDPAWGKTYTGGFAPYAFWIDPPLAFTVSPTPSGTFTTDDKFYMRGIWTISSAATDATVFPDVALDYGDEISDGAIAQLLRIPGKSWTDPMEAKARDKAFMEGCAAGRIRAATGGTNNILPPDIPQTA